MQGVTCATPLVATGSGAQLQRHVATLQHTRSFASSGAAEIAMPEPDTSRSSAAAGSGSGSADELMAEMRSVMSFSALNAKLSEELLQTFDAR